MPMLPPQIHRQNNHTMSYPIPHNRPTLGRYEKLAASRVLDSKWVAQGKETESFENEFCKFLELPEGHAVALSSGSAALYLALWVLQAGGSSVYFPGYACAALRNAVSLAGAKALVGDVAADSPNLDLQLIPAKTDILIAPHMFGIPFRFDKVSPRISIIEDCAQALGARIDGKPAGLQGRISIFSFYATKLITSGGQGGMVVSRDRELISEIRDYRQFDCRHDRISRFNFQMTDLQAAIGRVQLARLDEFMNRREAIFTRYKRSGVELLQADGNDLIPVRYRAVVTCEHPAKVVKALKDAGIGSIVPIEDWELLDLPEKLPNAYQLTKRTVSLPIYPTLKAKEVDLIARVARRFL